MQLKNKKIEETFEDVDLHDMVRWNITISGMTEEEIYRKLRVTVCDY